MKKPTKTGRGFLDADILAGDTGRFFAEHFPDIFVKAVQECLRHTLSAHLFWIDNIGILENGWMRIDYQVSLARPKRGQQWKTPGFDRCGVKAWAPDQAKEVARAVMDKLREQLILKRALHDAIF